MSYQNHNILDGIFVHEYTKKKKNINYCHIMRDADHMGAILLSLLYKSKYSYSELLN